MEPKLTYSVDLTNELQQRNGIRLQALGYEVTAGIALAILPLPLAIISSAILAKLAGEKIKESFVLSRKMRSKFNRNTIIK